MTNSFDVTITVFKAMNDTLMPFNIAGLAVIYMGVLHFLGNQHQEILTKLHDLDLRRIILIITIFKAMNNSCHFILEGLQSFI